MPSTTDERYNLSNEATRDKLMASIDALIKAHQAITVDSRDELEASGGAAAAAAGANADGKLSFESLQMMRDILNGYSTAAPTQQAQADTIVVKLFEGPKVRKLRFPPQGHYLHNHTPKTNSKKLRRMFENLRQGAS